MKIRPLYWLLGMLFLLSMSACGGGGGSTPTVAASQNKTFVKGTASKGIIYPGTVYVYAVNGSGVKGALLAGPVATAIDGTYNAGFADYSGAILIEASGTYTDEATGQAMTISAAKPLHALLDTIDSTTDNNKTVAVTPLTEIAWRVASANGTKPTPAATIRSSNSVVASVFKIDNIVSSVPVRPDTATMANSGQQSQVYTLALATISQMAATNTAATAAEKLEAVLGKIAGDIDKVATGSVMSTAVMDEFNTALGSVTLGGDFPEAKSQVSGMGKISRVLTLSTSGTLPTGAKIFAIQGTLALPVDGTTGAALVSLHTDSNGTALSDVFKLTGTAGISGLAPLADYLAAQQQVDFSVLVDAAGQGMATGDFATLTYDVPAGSTVSAADFSLVAGTVLVKNANGVDIPGVTVTVK